MTDKQYKPFSEYREKDYRLPRSTKEAYGYDPVLYTYEKERDFISTSFALVVLLVVLLLSAAFAAFLWVM